MLDSELRILARITCGVLQNVHIVCCVGRDTPVTPVRPVYSMCLDK